MSQLDSHIGHVQNKLALAVFVRALAWSVGVFSVLLFLTVAVHRLFNFTIPFALMAVKIAAGLALLLPVIYAILRRPSPGDAAVAIDLKLKLKEKFSTALFVRRLTNDPFAAAALKDAEATASAVNLRRQFPLVFPRAAYGALLALAMLGLGYWLLPQFDPFGKVEKRQRIAIEEARRVDAKRVVERAIATVNSYPKAMQDSQAVQLARRDLENLLHQPVKDPEHTSRSALKALQDLNEAVKDEVKKSERFATAQSDEKMFRSLTPPQDQQGPVADAQRAIAQGDFAKAADELHKTADKFNKMSEEEKKKANDQMKQLAKQLQLVAQDPAQQQQLQKQLQQMGANPQQIQKMAQAMQQAAAGNPQAQQQLQQMQQQMQQQMNNGQGPTPQQKQQIQQLMKQMQAGAMTQQQANQMAQAAQQMAQAMQQASQPGGQQNLAQSGQQMAQGMQQMQQQLDQMDALQKDAQQVAAAQQAGDQAAQDAAGQLSGSNPGQQDGQGKGQGQGEWKAGDPKQKGNGMGGPGIGNGGVARKTVAPFSVKAEAAPVQDIEKGKILASTFVNAGTIKGDSKAALQSVAKAAVQEQTDEVDEQSVGKESQRVVKDYFETMQKAP